MDLIQKYLDIDKKYIYYGGTLFLGLRLINSIYNKNKSDIQVERDLLLDIESKNNVEHEVLIDNEGEKTFNTFLLDEVKLGPHESSDIIRLLRIDTSSNEKNIYIIYGIVKNFGNTWRFESSYIEKYIDNEIKNINSIQIQSVLLISNASFKWDNTDYVLIEKKLSSIKNYNYKKDSLIDNSDNKARFSKGLYLKRNDMIPLLK